MEDDVVTVGIGVAIVSILALAVMIGARWIVPFLSGNQIVIDETVRYIYISMISEPIMASGVIMGGALNGAGDTRSVLIRVAMSVWFVRIPLCYVFVVLLGFGPASVWWSMNASQVVHAYLIYRRYSHRAWLSND